MIDISDPTNPTLLGTYNTPDIAYGVTVSGDHAFVADYGSGLQVIRVFQSEVDADNNVGRSLGVDASDAMIPRARLTCVQTEEVAWELSADGGINWQWIVPDGNWNAMLVLGTDLLWRSTHTWAAPGVNPGVSELEIEWLVEAAPITSIVDVPNDQGGWVRINFLRSGYDFSDETTLPVTGYQIYQLVDELEIPQPASEDSFDSRSSEFEVAPLEGVRVWNEGGRVLARGEAKAAGIFPPGTWAVIGWVAGTQVDDYRVRFPTAADSTSAGVNMTTFLVTTHTTTPSVWFASQPDSGYSLDNIAPGMPRDILAGYLPTGVTLDWDDAPEVDFHLYRIYRGDDAGFVPAPDNLIHETAASTWTDPATNPWGYHYKITVLDHAGNESEAGSPMSVSGVQDGGVPARTALLNAVPNPFNPSTKLFFEMTAAGHARLDVYDVAGRLVATLVDEQRDAGRHHVTWDGRDAAGRASAAGVYLYRLETGDYSETKRMVLVK